MKKRIAMLMAVLMTLALVVGCSCRKEPAIEEQGPTEAPKQETVLPGVWTVSDVMKDGDVLSSQELRSSGFDLVVTLYADGTGTVSVNGFESLGTQKITYTDSSAAYLGKEYAFTLRDGAILVDYPYNNAVYSIRLTRQGDAPEPAPTAEPTPIPTPEPIAEPVPDAEAPVGTWKVTDVAADGHVLSENEMRYYRFDLVVELLDDGTGTVTSVSDRDFSAAITFDGASVNYNGVEIPYAFDGEAITLEYPLSGLTFKVKLERMPEIIPADPAELIGTWKTAKIAAGDYVLSENEIKSYGFDLLVTLNSEYTGTVTSPSYPNFKEEIAFNGSTVTYQGVEIPFLFEDDTITLEYSMNGIAFTVTLERAPEPEDAPVDAKQMLSDAFAKTEEAQSLHIDLTIDVIMRIVSESLGGIQSMAIKGDLRIDRQKDPEVIRMEGDMETGGQKQSMLLYAEVADDAVVFYQSEDGGKTWKRAADTLTAFTDPDAILQNWMSFVKTLDRTGVDTVDGTETTVFTGTLSSDFLTDSGLNLLDSMGGMSLDELMRDLDDIPFTVNVDSKTGYVVRYRLDMNDAMQTLMQRYMNQMLAEYGDGITVEFKIDSAIVEYTISQINAVPAIVIPDEARTQKTAEPSTIDGADIVGVWALCAGSDETQEYVEMMLSLGMTMEITFNADGTGTLSIAYGGKADNTDFTYTAVNGQLLINGEETPCTFDGDLLTIDIEDMGLFVFKKQ